MAEKINTKKFFYEIVSAFMITVSVIPGFFTIGNLFLQIFLTAFIVIAFLSVCDRNKVSPVTVSHSLIVMCIFWIAFALIKQISLHLRSGDKSFQWQYIFYYDRPAMLIVVYFAVIVFFAALYIKYYNDPKFYEQYVKFQKTTLAAFTFYYSITLFYGFFLIRDPYDGSRFVNFIPFNFFKIMEAGEYEYEYIFLFFGNIAIFLPLGVLLAVMLKNRRRKILIAAPFIASVGIETVQFIFKLGWADIDDVILNVIGFYIGVAVKIAFDRIIEKVSHGKIKSVFVL